MTCFMSAQGIYGRKPIYWAHEEKMEAQARGKLNRPPHTWFCEPSGIWIMISLSISNSIQFSDQRSRNNSRIRNSPAPDAPYTFYICTSWVMEFTYRFHHLMNAKMVHISLANSSAPILCLFSRSTHHVPSYYTLFYASLLTKCALRYKLYRASLFLCPSRPHKHPR